MLKFFSIWIFLLYLLPFSFSVKIDYFFYYILVLFTFLSFYFGTFIFEKKKSTPFNYSKWLQASYTQLILSFIFFIIFRFPTIIDVFTHLFLGDYIQWSLSKAVSRYKGDEEEQTIFYQLGTISMFIYSILLGTFFSITRIKLYSAILCLFFIILIESSTLGRAGTLVCIVAIISEMVIRKNHILQSMPIKKILKVLFIIFTLFLLLFFYSAYNRLDTNDDPSQILFDKFGEYVIGPYQAFFIWFQNPNSQNIVNYPFFNLFTSIYKIAGIKVEQGFYPLVMTDFGETNIYTVLRAFYSDFGWILTSLFFFIFGIFIKYITFKKMNIISYFFLRFIFCIFLMVVLSPYYFTTFLLASIISFFLIFYNKLMV